jgi:hypothetical protein
MSEPARNVETGLRMERLLATAFRPVDPPAGLVDELEAKLTEVQAAAIEALEEISDWELASLRDPRNWVRPAAAVVVGGLAAGGLVLVRARQQHKKRQARGLRALEKSLRDVADDLEKRLRR